AGSTTGGSRSTRRNAMPLLTAAGLMVRSTRCPECNPMPVVWTGCLRVRCLIMRPRPAALERGEQGFRATHLELAGRFAVQRLDDAVLDQHGIAVRAHAHATGGEIEREAAGLGKLGAAVG